MSEKKITVVDRTQPRVAIEITEIVFDQKTKGRKRKGRAHMTVYGVSGEDAQRIIAEAFGKAAEAR